MQTPENVTPASQQICPKCGGEVVQAEVLGGNGQLVLTRPRTTIALGILRASAATARVCTACGYVELYATNPEVLK